jgi:hypothetical protein
MIRDPTKPGQPPSTSWEPKILGMNKRDLLRDILPILGSRYVDMTKPVTNSFLLNQLVGVLYLKWLKNGKFFWRESTRSGIYKM